MVSPREKRAAAHHLIEVMDLSERKACQVVGLGRSTYRTPPAGQLPTDPDAGFRSWLCSYAKTHPRWGYRRAHADARAEGWHVNHKKTQRIWREEGLRVPQRRRRKRHGSSTAGETVAAAYANHVWAIDFQNDRVEDGRAFKVASIVDEHTRESLDGTVDHSITGEDVVSILERIAAVRGYPAVLRMDNGPEFVSNAVARWAEQRVGLVFIPPGQPWKNGYVESFHARQRDECLNINHFTSLLHAKVEIADWNHEYNHVRQHSSLGYRTPAEYAATCTCSA
jgi:transposase InsO family protein